MAQTPCLYVSDGQSQDYLASADKQAGEVVVVGSDVHIVARPIDYSENPLGTVHDGGMWDMPQAAEVISAGTKVYWDADGDPCGGTKGSGAVTATDTGNTLLGTAALVQPNGTNATAATDEYVRVLRPERGLNIATVAGSMTADDITGSDAALTIGGIAGSSGAGGTVVIVGGAGDTNAAGGATSRTGGAGNGSGAGGACTLVGGAGGATGAGGAVTITAGAGGSTSGANGTVAIAGGVSASSGNIAGGAVSLTGGAGKGSAAGGASSVVGGVGGATGAGGAIAVTGGAGGATSGTGGAVAIAGGAGTNGNANGGAISILGGNAHGSGTDGAVSIGTSNTSAITIGAASIAASIVGPMSRTAGASTAAAGSTVADAGALPAGTAGVYPTTAADDTKGVVVSTSDKVDGRMIFIGNGVSDKILKVYGPSGASINGGSADAAFSSASGKGVIMYCLSASGNTWLAW